MNKKIYFYVKKIVEIVLNLILLYAICVLIIKYSYDISYFRIFQNTTLILQLLYTYFIENPFIFIFYVLTFLFILLILGWLGALELSLILIKEFLVFIIKKIKNSFFKINDK